MPIRTNPCLRSNGTPKSAYASRAEAQAWIARQPVADVVGLCAYRCKAHGWHVGSQRYEQTKRRRRAGKGSW